MREPLPGYHSLRRLAAQEAVDNLRLLKPHTVSTVDRLLTQAQELHPRTICSAYRKQGKQLPDEEKKRLGIRKNGFMSREALEEISELGLKDPIRAHELTVLRASFALFRHRNAISAQRFIREQPELPIEVQYDVSHPDACEKCKALHHKPVGPDWGLLPPSGCTCVTAPYGLHIHADWFAQLAQREGLLDRSRQPSLVRRGRDVIRKCLGLGKPA